MKTKIKMRLLFLLPLLLLTNCERKLTTDIVPPLTQREAWGKPVELSINSFTLITENNENRIEAKQKSFELYKDAFKAYYMSKDFEEDYVTKEIHAYIHEDVTYIHDSTKDSWEVIDEPRRTSYKTLYNNHYAHNLMEIEDKFILQYNNFITQGSEKGFAATISEYKKAYPGAKVSATLIKPSTGGYNITEKVEDFPGDTSFYILNDFLLKLRHGKPNYLSLHWETGDSERIIQTKIQISFLYSETLPNYNGPLYGIDE